MHAVRHDCLLMMQDGETKNVTLPKQSLLTWQDQRHFITGTPNATSSLGLHVTTRRHPALAISRVIRQQHDLSLDTVLVIILHRDTQTTLVKK
jgi:hypothetical protein